MIGNGGLSPPTDPLEVLRSGGSLFLLPPPTTPRGTRRPTDSPTTHSPSATPPAPPSPSPISPANLGGYHSIQTRRLHPDANSSIPGHTGCTEGGIAYST